MSLSTHVFAAAGLAAMTADPPDLGAAPLGYRGRIRALRPMPGPLAEDELERRLVELGFVEGAVVELLHQGLLGRDPIAVRVDGVTIALRRAEARAVLVEALDSPR